MMTTPRRIWGHSVGIVCLALVSAGASGSALAQQTNLAEMQRNIDIFSGVLREGLGLNSRSGIFSPLNGSVRGTYFMEQGIVLEIASPLANSRSVFNWQTLEGSLQQLSGQISSFVNNQSGRVSPPDLDAMRESMALSLRAENAQGAYAQLLEHLRSIDLATEVETALASASESARSLHQLGKIDDARLNEFMAEVNEWRRQANERIVALQALRSDVSDAANSSSVNDEAAATQFQNTLDQIVAALAPVREAATSRAAELSALAAQAKREREAQWQQELIAFETNLFGLVCNYAGALRTLPDDERLTLVLKGLGEETESRRKDRIHVLSKHDMQSCLQGELAGEQLQASARTYDF